MYPKRKATRMAGFDYSTDNLYFVTSCVKNKVCCFGRVVCGKMQLNAYGEIAEQQWAWLSDQYPYVVLHAFIVMHSMPGRIIFMGLLKLILLWELYGQVATCPYGP